MISVHEEGLWPRTGLIDDDAGGNAINLPVPRGFNDREMAFVRDALILPKVAEFAPDAVVFLCGADGVEDDPLAHLSMSNNAHWDILRGLMDLGAPRLLVLGGGGYNPWTVGRLWTGVWAVLNGHSPDAPLTEQAQDVLRALTFKGNSRGRNPPEHWFTTLRDAPQEGGAISQEVRQRVDLLRRRPLPSVRS
jgi:acetoin utilization protein AcuC